MSIYDAAVVAAEEYARNRDAALEVLRPFARIGRQYRERNVGPLKVVLWAEEVGGNEDFAAGFFLAALEFWQSHRPDVEP